MCRVIVDGNSPFKRHPLNIRGKFSLKEKYSEGETTQTLCGG